MVSHRKTSCLFCVIAAGLLGFGFPLLAQSGAGTNLPDAPAARLLALNAPSPDGAAMAVSAGQAATPNQTAAPASQQPP